MSKYDSLKSMITRLSYSTNENFKQKTTLFITFTTVPFFTISRYFNQKGFSPFSLSSFIYSSTKQYNKILAEI